MGNLRQIVEDEIAKYAVEGVNSIGYLFKDDVHGAVLVVDIGEVRGERLVDISLMVRFVGDLIIID
jgi:hypothetical protein